MKSERRPSEEKASINIRSSIGSTGLLIHLKKPGTLVTYINAEMAEIMKEKEEEDDWNSMADSGEWKYRSITSDGFHDSM